MSIERSGAGPSCRIQPTTNINGESSFGMEPDENSGKIAQILIAGGKLLVKEWLKSYGCEGLSLAAFVNTSEAAAAREEFMEFFRTVAK